MGYTMSKCRNCNIEILDASPFCPLCRTVLETDDSLENMYPNEHIPMRKYHFLSRIYLFTIILIELVLVLVNITMNSEIWWCIISALVLIYSYLVLRYAIIGKSGHRTKAFVLILLAVLSAIAIDFVLGYRGWAIDFMLPTGIIVMDAVLLICILINRRCWHSYITWLISMQIFSIIPVILYAANLEKHWYLAHMPMLFTAVILLGVFIIGGKRSFDEVKRRFHIN